MRPMHSQFIIDEILQGGPGAAVRVAKHQYGCRVLQRLFEHCSKGQLEPIVHQLLGDAMQICTHNFGQFVLQHLCEHGTAEQVSELTELLAQSILTVEILGQSILSVLNKAFDHACPEARALLANALLARPDQLMTISSSRYGHLTVKKALQMAEQTRKLEALTTLLAQKKVLMSSRYGRVLSKHLDTF